MIITVYTGRDAIQITTTRIDGRIITWKDHFSHGAQRGIECFWCRSVSHNVNDITHRWCGRCHRYQDCTLETRVPQ